MRLLLAAILALLPLPALADVTARYSAGKEVLLVEVDDGGNTRIGIDGKFSIIGRDGIDYAVLTTPAGEIGVVDLVEFTTLFSAMMSGRPEQEMGDVGKFLLLARGETLVGERKGALWSFGPESKPDRKPEKMLEVVISDDPALGPVAAVFRGTFAALLPLLRSIMPESTGFAGMATELMAKGAPLRIDELIELQSVGTTEIDPKRFELPGPVLPAAEFVEKMGMMTV